MKSYILFITLLFAAIGASAQHHQNMKMSDTTKKNMRMNSTKPMVMDGMDMSNMKMDSPMHHMMMTSQFSRDLPMNRDGSGTSWVPDETPLYAYMIHGKKWMSMVHGSFFARYNNQDLFNKGKRGGGNRIDVPNWLMFMTQRKVGNNGLFSIIPCSLSIPF
jgi:hypothetical protein